MSFAARRLVASLFCLFVALPIAPPAFAEKRIALVVGVDRYPNLPANRQLQKAVNDARAVAGVLTEIGFKVTAIENVSRLDMSRAIGALEQSIAPGDTVFLFFAGHGIDVAGSNYLLPGDVPSPVDREGRRLPARALRDASFNAAEVLASLQERGARTVISVFDACREPFDDEGKRSLGLGRGGLAEMKPASGMFIMFSAGAKQLALDRLASDEPSPNSIFTRTLLPLLKEPGLSLVQLAKQVQPAVKDLAATIDHVQTPAYYDQIIGDFYLVPGRAIATQPARPPEDRCADAVNHWRSAEAIGTREAVQAHLAIHSSCPYAGLARAKLAAIEQNERARAERAREEQLREDRAREERAREARLHEERMREEAQAVVCQRPGSMWDLEGSTVYLEGVPNSPARKFYFCQPTAAVRASGVRAGSLLFDGRRTGSSYSGTAYVAAGRCGQFSYSVTGQVTNGDRTVVITGRQPNVDESTCKITSFRDRRLELTYQRRVN
jgi:uncharacterized caspase-like protein